MTIHALPLSRRSRRRWSGSAARRRSQRRNGGGAPIERGSATAPACVLTTARGGPDTRRGMREGCARRDRVRAWAWAAALAGGGERAVELVELAVDRDAQRLERALGRMAAGEARRRRDRGLDELDELLRGVERPRAHDRAGDLVGVALLAELAQHARQAPCVP